MLCGRESKLKASPRMPPDRAPRKAKTGWKAGLRRSEAEWKALRARLGGKRGSTRCGECRNAATNPNNQQRFLGNEGRPLKILEAGKLPNNPVRRQQSAPPRLSLQNLPSPQFPSFPV